MIEVHEVNINVPGTMQADAGQLGKQIAEYVAAGIGDRERFQVSKWDELNLDVQLIPGMSTSEMAVEISNLLLQRLRAL